MYNQRKVTYPGGVYFFSLYGELEWSHHALSLWFFLQQYMVPGLYLLWVHIFPELFISNENNCLN